MMIQGIIAIILLVLAICLYFWGRRSSETYERVADPDVILGLTQRQEIMPVAQQTSAPKLVERIILFLRAPAGRQYGGYELLQSLLSCGLRFGAHNIFHRYEQQAENLTELFSVAAATQTGELNPAHMGDFTCSGLSIFLTLNQHGYPSVNFELMLDAARQLAEDLGGNLLDEQQAILTAEKIEQLRGKIKAFETNQRTMELFV